MTRFSKKTVMFMGALAIGGMVAAAAPAKADSSALFILDASGSMWGRLDDGRSKIAVARDVMRSALGIVPQSTSTGLMVYGHRRKGDCSDIQLVTEMGAGNADGIAGRVGRIVPRGKTPISKSLEEAGRVVTGMSGDKTVVLVSDGIETCAGDPCAVAESLANADAGLKIHVVGYDVDAPARKQLMCIADKGRGTFFDARDASALNDALKTVATSVATKEPVPEPVVEVEPPKAEQPSVAATSTGTKIKIAGPGTIEIAPAAWLKQKPKYWKLIDPETGEVITKTSAKKIKVKPGTYQIAWRHVEHGGKEVALSEVVKVTSRKTSKAVVDTGLRLVPPKGVDKKPYYWQLLPLEANLKKSFRSRDFAAQYSLWDAVPVPAGTYKLVLRQTEHGHSEVDMGPVTVEAGKLNEIVLDQGINLQWPAEWNKSTGRKTLYRVKLTAEDGSEVKARYRGPLILPAGKYAMTVRIAEHGWKDVDWGTVNVPESGYADPKITSGITFLSQDEAKHTIYAVNLETGKETSIRNNWGPIALPAGEYRIDYRPLRSDRYTIVEQLEVKTGQMIEAEM